MEGEDVLLGYTGSFIGVLLRALIVGFLVGYLFKYHYFCNLGLPFDVEVCSPLAMITFLYALWSEMKTALTDIRKQCGVQDIVRWGRQGKRYWHVHVRRM